MELAEVIGRVGAGAVRHQMGLPFRGVEIRFSLVGKGRHPWGGQMRRDLGFLTTPCRANSGPEGPIGILPRGVVVIVVIEGRWIEEREIGNRGRDV